MNLKFLGWPYSEKWLLSASSEDFFSGDDFEFVLDIFYFYDYGVNASEAIGKIAANGKDYHKYSLCVIIGCIARAYHQ